MPLDFSNLAKETSQEPPKQGGLDFSALTKETTPSKEKYSQLGSAAIGAAESLTPTAAGLAAAGYIANIVAPISATMAVTGPGIIPATLLEVGAPMIGGAIVGIATSMGQHAILPESVNKEIAKAEADNPKTFFAAGLLDQLPFFGVGAATKATRAVLGGLGGLTEAGSELSQGKPLDPTKIGLSTIAGGTLTKPTKAGNWLTQGAFSGHTTPLQSKDLPQEDSRLTETINKWAKMNESDVQLKETPEHPKTLVQTAIKDKATGAIEPMGPKHDEARKAETVDTHDQGFLTKDGTFLNRKEAAGWARETGQIPQDHKLERPSEGLHSGDLRTAGDSKFDLPKPIPTPESINTKSEFDEAGRKVLQDHGPEAAKKFAKDVATYRRIKENETIPQVLERNRVWNESVANASTPLEKAAIINGDIVLEQIDHTNTIYGAQEAIGQALNDIRVAIRDSDIARHDIEKAVPELEIRELMTRAAEGERWYDKLYTDRAKEEYLASLEGALNKYNKILAHLRGSMSLEVRSTEGQSISNASNALWKTDEFKNLPISKQLFSEKRVLTESEWANIRQERANALEKKIKRIEYSLNKRKSLGSEEHAIPVLKAIQKRLAKIGTQAKELGLMKGWLNNYIPHVLDFSKTNMTKSQQQNFLKKILVGAKESKLERDFTQQRHYDTLRELEKAVDGTGVVVHTDIAKIMQAYEKAMQTSFIQKKLLDKLSTTLDSSGRPMVVDVTKLSGEEAAKYLKDKYVPFQGKGSKFLENILVSPEIEAAMGHMATQKDPRFALRSMGAVTHLTKVVNTVGSLFHAKSLAEVNLLINPVNALKEVFTAGAGTRAAVRELQTNRDNTIINDFIKSGLVVEMPEDIQRTIIAELGKTIDRGLGHIGFGPNLRATQRATDPFDQHILQNLNKFTWDYMHSGSKVRVAMDLFAKAKAKNPEIPDAVHMKEISNFVNNAFGGVNWLQEANQIQGQFLRGLAQAAAGIRGREYGQIIMFAPDWTYSTIKTMVNALPKELMKPKNWELRAGLKGIYNPTKTGDYARRYALATAITYATVLNGINMAMSGHSMLENKDPTRIDLGDGTSMQGAKHSLEVLHLLRDPDAYLGNKLGFIPKSVAIITTGTAYPSPRAPKLKDTSMLGRARAVGLAASPFQVSSGAQAPEGEGLKRAVASTLGFPIYGRQTSDSLEAEVKATKARERAQKRIERAKEKRERSYSHQ